MYNCEQQQQQQPHPTLFFDGKKWTDAAAAAAVLLLRKLRSQRNKVYSGIRERKAIVSNLCPELASCLKAFFLILHYS